MGVPGSTALIERNAVTRAERLNCLRHQGKGVGFDGDYAELHSCVSRILVDSGTCPCLLTKRCHDQC